MPEFTEDIYAGEEDIDFSDLEKQYETNPEFGLEQFVVIDGAPAVPAKKVEALTRVLKKMFGSVGKVESFYMPVNEDGSTKGYIFLEYADGEQANEAIKQYHHKKLDVKHTLLVNKLADVERYGFSGAVATEYVEPEITEFSPREHLRNWLTDPSGRDQFLVQKGKAVEVYWNKRPGGGQPELAMEHPVNTQTFTRWSPKGTFLCTFHLEGVQVRGGPNWNVLGQFPHRKPEAIDFSPNEKFIVTISKEPIKLPPADHAEERARCPFTERDEGNAIVVWDVKTALPLRTFPLQAADTEKKSWPIFKWSSDDRYFARTIPGESLAIYEAPSMGLLDKKTVKIPGISDFEFSPAPVQLEGKKEPTQVLCFWSPELANQTARVSIMEVPSKEIVRSRNLFNVAGCRLHWQDQARFLCVKVDRHTKTKKSTYTNLEFFRLQEKAIPVEVLELKETVINFAWEPKGDRFAIVSRADTPTGPAPPAHSPAAGQPAPAGKPNLSFYALERAKGALGKWRLLKNVEKKTANSLFWSPRGRFLVSANIVPSGQVDMDFWDFDHDVSNNTEDNLSHIGSVEPYGTTDVQWDPSGRFVATYSSSWRHKIQNGYKVWDFRGSNLLEEDADHFGCLIWRPRPECLLSKDQKKKIRKDLKSYSRKFDEDDAMEASEANRELIMRRRAALAEWREWREQVEKKLLDIGVVPESQQITEAEGDDVIEEITEEVVEEKEEELD